MHHKTHEIENQQGLKIFCQDWVTPRPERATALLLHGFGEHSSRYEELAQALVAADISLHSFDLAGHGKSEGKRGVFTSFEDLYDDIDRVVESILAHPKEELIVIGHSMGGLIALGWSLSRKNSISAVVVSSPLLGLALKVPMWKAALSKILSAFPRVTFKAPVDATLLTHDEEMVAKYENDPLVHQYGSGRFLFAFQKEAEYLIEHAKDFTHPLFMMLSGDDRVVDLQQSLKYFEHAGSSLKHKKVYKGLFHELFHEHCRHEIYEDLIGWIDSQILSTSSETLNIAENSIPAS